ncbi:MAG: hypothetical protein LBV67_04470 [Streptococcaceae bacterium]|jgi:hypothetical protein|nr:hypothetical protein [Streptococcaceae bacterium]
MLTSIIALILLIIYIVLEVVRIKEAKRAHVFVEELNEKLQKFIELLEGEDDHEN